MRDKHMVEQILAIIPTLFSLSLGLAEVGITRLTQKRKGRSSRAGVTPTSPSSLLPASKKTEIFAPQHCEILEKWTVVFGKMEWSDALLSRELKMDEADYIIFAGQLSSKPLKKKITS